MAPTRQQILGGNVRRTRASLLACALVAGATVTAPSATAAPVAGNADDRLEVFVGQLKAKDLNTFAEVGLDHEDVATAKTGVDTVKVEAVMTAVQARKLRAAGIDLNVKTVGGKTAAQALAARAAEGFDVFRSYSEDGGIRDELTAAAAAHPRIAERVLVGRSLQGKPIYAVRVTKDARTVEDGARPAVLYNGAQHAREWITPEMVRRLMHHVLDGYGKDAEITRLVDTREMWFLPVANPDGYDFTFTEDNRLWRKNLRDNDGDHAITGMDGVDPNRNFPTRWGWDNEGSSPDPSDATYRGPAPASEPETRAMDSLVGRVGFEFQVNYHSAAELILYGTGWQVHTPTPDDVIYEALAGDDEHPAVPGYDPDLSAELYTTNGETTKHVHDEHGTLAFTPEMSTCETASNVDPDDEWRPEDCLSVFNFPDDEELIQAEFAKNVPFALSMAKSADDPDDPESVVGRDTPNFRIDPFTASFGKRQTVSVIAKRALRDLRMHYRVEDGPTVTTAAKEWRGGERYGSEKDVYYAEYRAAVAKANPSEHVTVWFSGAVPGAGRVKSRSFTYRVRHDIGGDVLILAAEDVTGASPSQDRTRGKYVAAYAKALQRAGYSVDTYDVDRFDRRAPHHLGVLSHYKAVLWETGDDIIPRGASQPGGTAAKLALDLELAVRDYVNEGGKLVFTGQYAGFAQAQDGSYFYNPNEAEQGECAVREYPCLPLSNDFLQYWLGAYQYVSDGGSAEGKPLAVRGTAGPFAGFRGTFEPGTPEAPTHTASFLTTSSFLPPAQFPQFSSSAPLQWDRQGGAPYEPYTGNWYLYSQRGDSSYKRLARTVDLTGASSGALTFRASYDTEADWDYVFVEARPVGTQDWTTLPDANGHTATGTGESCASAWRTLHPHLNHYQGEKCEPTGTTGEWHAATGNSNGWTEWDVDLSRYAGQQVELSISYASDWGTQGLGVFLDDVAVAADGTTVAETSFETDDLAGFEVSGPAEGSGPNGNDWARSQKAFEEGAGVVTDDTVYVGFGGDTLRHQGELDSFVKRSMAHLLD